MRSFKGVNFETLLKSQKEAESLLLDLKVGVWAVWALGITDCWGWRRVQRGRDEGERERESGSAVLATPHASASLQRTLRSLFAIQISAIFSFFFFLAFYLFL